ncbi:hypothetical protein [Pseudoalteromonas piratica]|uniref:hypothetical protein n=1 Tax=Pseudoalteromonas piratica TaxID=1348114 RepID=UPI00068956A1|nr:hypothetical protein [Pseudoalteromonas piratica]
MGTIQQTKDFSWPNNWLNDAQINELKLIFASCFKGISSDDYYQKYFADAKSFKRTLRCYYFDGKLVGYCLLTFEHSNKKVLIRASAGFYPEFRKGGNTLSFSISQAFKYWLTHPWQQIFYADTMLSPAMYRAIVKRVAISYPSNQSVAGQQMLFDEFNGSGFESAYTKTKCLVETGRSSNYSAQELASFLASNKPEIAFYCKANPDFASGVALFVVMPVTLKQLVLTLFK